MNSLLTAAEQFQRHYNTLITGAIHPTEHPVAKGEAREHGWRKLFRRFLPDRYGVKSGFIIDSEGTLSDQTDCIIYRKDMGIELYSVGHHTVIPVEAVFGAFEIKPVLNKKNLTYAEDKASKIAKLKITNNLRWNSATGQTENSLITMPAEGSVILGLLADRIEIKKKWKQQAFKKLLSQPKTMLSVFMTVEDGCVDTLSTGYPTSSYRLYEGDHALLNQMIPLAESMAIQEKRRCLSSCCLSDYKGQLDKPTRVKV